MELWREKFLMSGNFLDKEKMEQCLDFEKEYKDVLNEHNLDDILEKLESISEKEADDFEER